MEAWPLLDLYRRAACQESFKCDVTLLAVSPSYDSHLISSGPRHGKTRVDRQQGSLLSSNGDSCGPSYLHFSTDFRHDRPPVCVENAEPHRVLFIGFIPRDQKADSYSQPCRRWIGR